MDNENYNEITEHLQIMDINNYNTIDRIDRQSKINNDFTNNIERIIANTMINRYPV